MKKFNLKGWINKALDDIFEIGIFIKLINGILELIGGMILLFIQPASISKVIGFFANNELIEDPKDVIANYFMHLSQTISVRMQVFAGIYLIIHAIINIGLFTLLWQKKKWAFPLAGSILTILIAYQVYLITQTYSMILIVFTLVDVVILALLRFEYVRSYPAMEKEK